MMPNVPAFPARSLARLRYALARHGAKGFVKLALLNLVRLARKRDRITPADLFDREHGTQTDGIREIGSLDASAMHAARSAVRYEPSDEQSVHNALARLDIDCRDYSFVDFGSGKGRVLLIAAGYPFKSVTGVEFSRELHEIAVRNIALFPKTAVRAGAVSSVCGDAAMFPPPPGNLVCYFYNPFGPPVISQVGRLLAAHSQSSGVRVIVIYVDPRYRGAFEQTGKFTVLDQTRHVLILAAAPDGRTGCGVAHSPPYHDPG